MLRVSRTDSRGRFVVKGIAPGSYRIYALQDMDGNYMFNQKSEKLAFSHDIIVPSCKPDVRQDTTWIDTLHIKSIAQVDYTHFYPDDIVLRAFTETLTDRYFLKSERKEPNNFSLFFSYGDSILPTIKGLNFNEKDAFLLEAAEKKDTLTYWLKDTALVNQDTLRMELAYRMTDSTGVLVDKLDTLEILAKTPYAKRQKQLNKELEDWTKKQENSRRKGSLMIPSCLSSHWKCRWASHPSWIRIRTSDLRSLRLSQRQIRQAFIFMPSMIRSGIGHLSSLNRFLIS